MYTVDGLAVQVSTQGPAGDRTVVVLDMSHTGESRYQDIRDRLHVAKVQTVGISAGFVVSDKAVIDILDSLRIPCAVLVADGPCADMAWQAAAHHPQRITGLVLIDGGHPRAANRARRDDDLCPHVFADTTVLVSSSAAGSIARASRCYVRGDFRMADLAGPRGSRHFIAQLSTEIVMRTLSV
jgi:pimeloyl-ACP methyl ester carboxylesterase